MMQSKLQSVGFPNELNYSQKCKHTHPCDNGHACSTSQRSSPNEIFPCLNPRAPEMQSFRNRIRTFLKGWPNQTAATAKQMAEAGLYYIGQRDRVKCHYCNGGLQNFERNDDPWFEHAKWYPHCEFVLKSKGIDYVARVAERFPDIKRPYDVVPISRLAADDSGGSKPVVPSPLAAKLPSAMETEIVKEALNFGFELDTVKTVVANEIQKNGCEFSSVAALVEAIQSFEAEMEEQQVVNESSQQCEVMDTCDSPPQNTYSYPATASNGHHLLPTPPQMPVTLIQTAGSKKLTPAITRQTPLNKTANALDLDRKAIQKKLDSVLQERLCQVCLDKERNCVLLGCGHVCCCIDCGSALRNCPICRAKIEKIVLYTCHTY